MSPYTLKSNAMLQNFTQIFSLRKALDSHLDDVTPRFAYHKPFDYFWLDNANKAWFSHIPCKYGSHWLDISLNIINFGYVKIILDMSVLLVFNKKNLFVESQKIIIKNVFTNHLTLLQFYRYILGLSFQHGFLFQLLYYYLCDNIYRCLYSTLKNL